ncbi:chemotaxis protein CheA [Thermoflexibacter ruber]|uniref:Chemotaxis protein CheA n=1 Tax=Thermoflexibacter ruber TaxID=1003 RepID=A0A1I2JB75_9BACT|nr:chemotaxis protein CheA [Thermoflexibacter ruber]SFF51240.1 two-component system, chemotaxis family, sensor kinase CheA [Thermoflexibacter ruber]
MKNDELKEIFLAEALESYEQLNRFFTQLEKDHTNQKAVEAIFRITHTLKANAAAMGYEGIAEIAHLLEDIFGEVKKGNLLLDTQKFNDLFRANDKLGELIQNINADRKIAYKGLTTKLKVILRESANKKIEGETIVNTPLQTELVKVDNELPNEEKIAEEEKNEEINATTSQLAFSDLIQVPIRKLDSLLNLVGELLVERDRLMLKVADDRLRKNEYARLYRLTSDLQYGVMNVRLVQVNLLFMKFHRIVRDVATLEAKKVNLVLEGTEIEIDGAVLQSISDAMVHLVRNAISHGIEPPTDRVLKSKSEVGTVKLSARNERDAVIIEISDDGKGINPEYIRKKLVQKKMVSQEAADSLSDDDVINYIFESGFSSAEQVTEVSGRGVGMDVVKNTINAIGGKISIRTMVNAGTTFSLALPTSLAVKSVMLFEVLATKYAIPIIFTEAVVAFKKTNFQKLGKGLVVTYLEETLPVIFLRDLFSIQSLADLYQSAFWQNTYQTLDEKEKIYIIIVSFDNKQIGLVVDKLVQQKEIVEKPLLYPLHHHKLISGTTILGDGSVCLVLDIPSIVNLLFRGRKALQTIPNGVSVN